MGCGHDPTVKEVLLAGVSSTKARKIGESCLRYVAVVFLSVVGRSLRDFRLVIIIVLLATVGWGIAGLFLIWLKQILGMQTFAEDSADKHGIAEIQASQLGGAAIIFGGLILLAAPAATGLKGVSDGPLYINWFTWISVIGCMLLGCVEDFLNNSLSPRVRMAVMVVIFGAVFWY